MMRYVVAVSGGVDSVVLLDVLRKIEDHELVVTHFDHGIREDSAADARFVAALAESYGLPFETTRVELGERASEDAAREARYGFLRDVASRHEAMIVTAHHQDDVIETVAINLTRGTGWRGLTPLNDPTIERPLLSWTKKQILNHALQNGLEWVEDSTNASDAYLRNRVRRKLASLPYKDRIRLLDLFVRQRKLASEIDSETKRLNTTSRHFLSMIDESAASELLRETLTGHSASLTRPQRQRLIHAIRTALPGSAFEAGGGVTVEFGLRDFIVKRSL